MATPARLIVGISGASGTIYGVRLLEMLRMTEVETHLVMSKSAEMTLVYETDLKPKDVRALASVNYGQRYRGRDLVGLVPDHGHDRRALLDPHNERDRKRRDLVAVVARRRCRAQGEAAAGAGGARDAAPRRTSAHHDRACRYRGGDRADRAGLLQSSANGR